MRGGTRSGYQFGLGSSLNTSRSAKPQRVRIIVKYSLSMSMLIWVASLNSSRRMMARSSGGPTDRLERMVESMETRAHLAAWARLLLRGMTRSMMGLPYFDSPIWKYGVSREDSMKLPAE